MRTLTPQGEPLLDISFLTPPQRPPRAGGLHPAAAAVRPALAAHAFDGRSPRAGAELRGARRRRRRGTLARRAAAGVSGVRSLSQVRAPAPALALFAAVGTADSDRLSNIGGLTNRANEFVSEPANGETCRCFLPVSIVSATVQHAAAQVPTKVLSALTASRSLSGHSLLSSAVAVPRAVDVEVDSVTPGVMGREIEPDRSNLLTTHRSILPIAPGWLSESADPRHAPGRL